MSAPAGQLHLVALVPMRHRSARVPGKNYRPLAGKPLYSHILRTLQACPEVERIVVDTDSETIQQGIRREFPEVELLERPAALRDERVSMNAVLLHDVGEVPSRYYLQTHSTNPLLRSQTISRAVKEFLEAWPEKDSLFAVTRLQNRLWDQECRPVNHDPGELLRTQDLPPLYLENSCLYIFERETFVRSQNRIGERPLMFEIQGEEAWDIDQELDFTVVECLLNWRGAGESEMR